MGARSSTWYVQHDYIRSAQLDTGKGNRMLRVRSAADINGASIQR